MKSRKLLIQILLTVLILLGLLKCFDTLQRYALVCADFAQDYAAAAALRNNSIIYGDKLTSFAASNTPCKLISNFHPPFAALALLPFSHFSYHTAFFVWGLISIAIVALTCVVVPRELKLSAFFCACTLAYLFWSYALESHLAQGQLSLLLALLIQLAWLCYRRAQSIASAALLALAAAIKLFPGFFIIYFITRRDWRACGSFIITFLILQILTFICVGQENFLNYFNFVMPKNVLEWGSFSSNLSISGMILPLTTENTWVVNIITAPGLAQLIIFFLQLALLYSWFKSIVRPCENNLIKLDLTFALTTVSMLLLSPLTGLHACLMLPFCYALLFDPKDVIKDKYWLFFSLLLFSLPYFPLIRWLQHELDFVAVPNWIFILTRFHSLALLIVFWRLTVRLREASATAA